MGSRRFILDVKPLLAPALDGVGKLHIKVSDFWPDADANTTYVVDGIPRVVAAEVKDAFPQAPVRVDAQETFAEGDENRDVEERVRGQLVQLNPIDKKEAAEKLMDGNGKAADEKIDESYPETGRRMRGTLIPWHLHGLLVEKAHLLEQAIVLRGDFRPLPSGDLVLLHVLLSARGTVLA